MPQQEIAKLIVPAGKVSTAVHFKGTNQNSQSINCVKNFMAMFRGGIEHLELKKKKKGTCVNQVFQTRIKKKINGCGNHDFIGHANSVSFILEYFYSCIFYNLSQKGINLYLHFAVIMQLARENIIVSSRIQETKLSLESVEYKGACIRQALLK